MINNTSIGKQMYKQKKEHGKGLVGLVFVTYHVTNFWRYSKSDGLHKFLSFQLIW